MRWTLLGIAASIILVSILVACSEDTSPPYADLPVRDALMAEPAVVSSIPETARRTLVGFLLRHQCVRRALRGRSAVHRQRSRGARSDAARVRDHEFAHRGRADAVGAAALGRRPVLISSRFGAREAIVTCRCYNPLVRFIMTFGSTVS